MIEKIEKEAKHTPGPWIVTRGAQSDAFSVESPTQTICNVKFIKGQSLSEKGIRQEEANAWLIAAAPALLDACKAVCAGFRDGSIKWAKPRQSDSDPYHKANTLMSAAVALAEKGA